MSASAPLPLSGVRVLDLGRFVAAPFCTQMLGDLGAEVIKIERPKTGDELRSYGPPFLKNRDGGDETSFDYMASNRNKKSVTVDISKPDGIALIKEIAKVSDVFVENFKAGHLKRFGLAYDDIAAVNPDIVYCSISGFGQTGPYSHRPGLDSIFQATSGLMSFTGEADGPPIKVGTVICDFTASMYSVVSIVSALFHRKVNGGPGQYIDIGLLDAAMAGLIARGQAYLCTGESPGRTGATTPGTSPAGRFTCSDGELIISAGSDDHFRHLSRILGLTSDDPRFNTRYNRVVNQDELTALMNQALSAHPRAYWIEQLVGAGVMCAPINTIGEAFNDPHVKSRGTAVEVDVPNVGPVNFIANPMRFSKTPIPTFKAPPRLGQHTDEIIGGLLGKSDEELERLKAGGLI